MRKLSDIFKTDNRQARRKILDKFDISAKDKNDVLNSVGTGGSGNGAFTYKSRKVVWKVSTKSEEILEMFITLPCYCVCRNVGDTSVRLDKAYGYFASAFIIEMLTILKHGGDPTNIYLEECEGLFKIKTNNFNGDEIIVETNGSLIDYYVNYMITSYGRDVSDGIPTEEEILQLLSSVGITQVPYEEYASIDVNSEFGCLTLKNI